MHSSLGISLLFLGLLKCSSAYYQPRAGAPWQIVLEKDIGPLNLPVDVYDIDLYTTPGTTIDQLHNNNKKVICYFSAGTYEPGRKDSGEIYLNKTEIGTNLTKEGYPLEQWLDIRSDRIVNIMKNRILDAYNANCDGVDPDNGMPPSIPEQT